jgi:hypothetical protein
LFLVSAAASFTTGTEMDEQNAALAGPDGAKRVEE